MNKHYSMMAAFNRRFLTFMLYIYQRNRKQNFQRVQNILSILINREERRKCLVRNSLIHLKYLITTYNMMKKKQRKPRSCRRFVRNKGWWETVRDNYDDNRFYETFWSAKCFDFFVDTAIFHYKNNRLSCAFTWSITYFI